MTQPVHPTDSPAFRPLRDAASLAPAKILNPESLSCHGGVRTDAPVLVVLAAGKGTRFGQDPKCIQPVNGMPLARHSIDAFRRLSPSPTVCIVGYRHAEVAAALGPDNVYVQSENPTGGTAFAAYEAFCVAALQEKNPLLVITMGDRVVPPSIFRRLCDAHLAGREPAALTFLSAVYEPPKNSGKGRVVRNAEGRVQSITEERDIQQEADTRRREALLRLTEGNCPLYAIRARTLLRCLRDLTNANAQNQYYLTDIIQILSGIGGEIRTITTTVRDPEYDLLCSDVTRPMDLALLEGILASSRGLLFPEEAEVEAAARAIRADRPAGQVASIVRQLRELAATVAHERLGFVHDRPIGIGISGGRLRIAFMHPDMVRFHGPAWQMPIGAGDELGEEQIVMLAQGADDRHIHLFPMNPKYRESVNCLPADSEVMYPGEEISDLHRYEEFGTRMSESLLLSLGYFSDEELAQRREKGLPLPPASLWASNNMRRPFALVGNAIASLRTLRRGNLGARVQQHLGHGHFAGLRMVSTGAVPQGGFSSSSAVTVATKNAINALYELGIPADLLVHLACQAEYGTGVRAGSLDQATEQKGIAGHGTLISSNPQDNYRIIGTYPVPAERFQMLFPYSIDRDRAAWRWSGGVYGEHSGSPALTTAEIRKLTGKAAEIAALLVRLPLDTSFFRMIEEDLVADGLLTDENRTRICRVLLQLPLLVRQADLRQSVLAQRDWYVAELQEEERLDAHAAARKADATIAALFAGWRDPLLRRSTPGGTIVQETGVPLRAIVAYLFGEMAKNFYLIHHPDCWIEYVSLSQGGDRCLAIDPERLPARDGLESELDWERGHHGPDLLSLWLDRCGAVPVDFNRGLDDATLSAAVPPEFHRLEGSNFFRGLALLDLAEAMLRRAFGRDAVAVRVNAAGQGDFFQVHIDTHHADPEAVKRFIRIAFYHRFGLTPNPEFVEISPGAGAVGIRLSRYDVLQQLVRRLEA